MGLLALFADLLPHRGNRCAEGIELCKVDFTFQICSQVLCLKKLLGYGYPAPVVMPWHLLVGIQLTLQIVDELVEVMDTLIVRLVALIRLDETVCGIDV